MQKAGKAGMIQVPAGRPARARLATVEWALAALAARQRPPAVAATEGAGALAATAATLEPGAALEPGATLEPGAALEPEVALEPDPRLPRSATMS